MILIRVILYMFFFNPRILRKRILAYINQVCLVFGPSLYLIPGDTFYELDYGIEDNFKALLHLKLELA